MPVASPEMEIADTPKETIDVYHVGAHESDPLPDNLEALESRVRTDSELSGIGEAVIDVIRLTQGAETEHGIETIEPAEIQRRVIDIIEARCEAVSLDESGLDPESLRKLKESVSPKCQEVVGTILSQFTEIAKRLIIERPEEDIEHIQWAEDARKRLEDLGMTSEQIEADPICKSSVTIEGDNSWVKMRGDKIVIALEEKDDETAKDFSGVLEKAFEFFPSDIDRIKTGTTDQMFDFTFLHEFGHVLQAANASENGEDTRDQMNRIFPEYDEEILEGQQLILKYRDVLANLRLSSEEACLEVVDLLERCASAWMSTESGGILSLSDFKEGDSLDEFEQKFVKPHEDESLNRFASTESKEDSARSARELRRVFDIFRTSGITPDSVYNPERGYYSYRMQVSEYEADEFATKVMRQYHLDAA